MKKFILSFLSVCIITTTMFTNYIYAENDEPQFEEHTKQYEDYIGLSEEEKSKVLHPIPIDISLPKSELSVQSIDDFPEKYDVRSEAKNYISDVRNQMNTNTCWTFSSCENLESFLNKKYSHYDSSEKHLFSTRHIENTTAQNTYDLYNSQAFSRNIESGGYQYLAAPYFMCGNGPVKNEDMPFENNTIPENTAARYIAPAAQVLDYQYLAWGNSNNLENNISEMEAQMKYVVTQYGSADVGINYTSNGYDSQYASFYDSNNVIYTSNHAVLLIGWDDTYPKENFKTEPSRDGAWIIQNSWGTDWGDNGCFYVSYDDMSLYNFNSFVRDAQDNIDYDNRYYYDPRGWNESIGYAGNDGVAYGANVFKKTSAQECLTDVVLGSRGYSNYEIYVNPSSSSLSSDSLTKVADGVIDFAGYKTITLDNPIDLTGTEFAVIVKYQTPNYDFSVPVSSSISDNYYANKIAEENTSFLSKDGESWVEISDENYNNSSCSIKALTKDVTHKTKVTFTKPSEASLVSVTDSNNTVVEPKANGSFSLPDGDYTYIVSTYHKKNITGQFTVSSEEEKNIEVTDELETGDYSPCIKNNVLSYPSDKNVYGDLVYEVDLGNGSLAANSFILYDEPELPVINEDYTIDGTNIIIKNSYIKTVMREYSNKVDGSLAWNLKVRFDDSLNTEIPIILNISITTLENISKQISSQVENITVGDTEETFKQTVDDINGGLYNIMYSDDFSVVPPTKENNGRINGKIIIYSDEKFKILSYNNKPIFLVDDIHFSENTLYISSKNDVDNVFLVLATYEENGALKSILKVDPAFSLKQDNESTIEFNNPDNDIVNTFLWKGNTMIPLYNNCSTDE